jgi:4-hydroxyphenylacetate 3-monooxygenase
MLKTGAEYLESIRDGRKVYIGSEEVTDVTTHPAFRNAAQSFARLYDRKRDADNLAVMSYEEDGECYSAWFLRPRSRDDLRQRAETHRRIARWTCGLLGRSPDHVAAFVTGLALKPEMFEANRQGFGTNLVRYWDGMRRHDTFACYTVLPPQGARKPELYQRAGRTVPTLRVTQETDRGVVLNGMKMLGTSAVFANETWVGNLLPLAPDQARESITCAVPLGLPGVQIWVRKPFERYAVSEFDNPLSWKFDETDGMVLFEDVEVPWERVFTHNDAVLSREIYFQSPSHCLGNHQSNIRFHEKLKVMLGVASLMTEINGVGHIPAVQGTLGKLAAAEAGLGGMIAGQIAEAEAMVPGYLTPNRRMMYAALQWCTTSYYQIAEEVRELLGAGPFQMPADISVVTNETLRAAFETYWSVPGQSATARMKFMKFAWDLLGGDFAGRHTQYEKFYAGPQFVNVAYSFLHCPWAEMRTLVEDQMAQYDVPIGVRQPLATE